MRLAIKFDGYIIKNDCDQLTKYIADIVRWRLQTLKIEFKKTKKRSGKKIATNILLYLDKRNKLTARLPPRFPRTEYKTGRLPKSTFD